MDITEFEKQKYNETKEAISLLFNRDYITHKTYKTFLKRLNLEKSL